MSLRLYISGVLFAASIGVISSSWAVGPLNTVNNGRIIQGGTYYNTPDSKTTFINRGSGGLWLKAGTAVRALEATSNGTLTNNGGTLHFYAPGNVVRLDGNVDASALRNSQGSYLGNGGKVFVDSSYLFQNGNVLANGANGGLVQINVGGMTLGVGAQIQAKGSTGAGGTVAINASGPVDLRRGSIVDTSGKVLGSFDSNLINIEGSLVNNEGTLRADGVNSRGGSIRLISSGQSPYQEIKDNLQKATINPSGDTSTPTITPQERIYLLQRTKGLIDHHEGEVFLARDTSQTVPAYVSNLSANGTGTNADPRNDYTQSGAPRAGDGGNVTLVAMDEVVNSGYIRANGARGASGANPVNGGNGGTISLLAQTNIRNTNGRLEANGGAGGASTSTIAGGKGGDGGLIAFGYRSNLTNTGNIFADGALGGNGTNPGKGGNGGLIVFSGSGTPNGNGAIDVIGRPGGNNNLFLGGKAGTIVSQGPSIVNFQSVHRTGYVNGQRVILLPLDKTQPVELLTHAENLIMLTNNGSSINVAENLFDRLNQAIIRSVTDPTGTLGQARSEVISKNTPGSAYVFRNLLLSSSRDNLALNLTHPFRVEAPGAPGELIFPSVLSGGQGFSTLNTLTILNNGSMGTQYLPGPNNDSPYQPTDFWLIGRNSNSMAGGRITLLANGGVNNGNIFGTTGVASGGSVHIGTLGKVNNEALLTTGGGLHGGNLLLKAGNDIVNDEAIYYAIGQMNASGGVMGGTIRMLPKNDFGYTSGVFNSSIAANGSLQGGIIEVNAGRNSIVDFSPITFDTPSTILANGTSSTLGRGGFIHLHAGNNNIHNGRFEASGGLENGTVLFSVGN